MLVSYLKGRLKIVTKEERVVKSSSGFLSCSTNNPRRVQVGLWMLVWYELPWLCCTQTLPRLVDGHSRTW